METEPISKKDYIKQNTLPIAVEAAFIISCLVLPRGIHIYTNTAFYLILFICFMVRKDFSFKEWGVKLKGGFQFWRGIAFTVAGFIAAVAITAVLENNFQKWDTGAIQLLVDSWPKLLCFVASTILFPAIVEETFFRKNITLLKGNGAIAITTVVGMILYGAEHFLTPWGIFLGMIWALPLSISYIKTRNIYIPITAHFIVSVLGNGLDVIALIQRLL